MYFRLIILLAIFLPDSALFAQPALNQAFEIDSSRIHQGLTYFHFQSDTSQALPLSIHVLRVDLNHIYLASALAMDQVTGQETTSSMVIRKGALAGINGGFSFSNDPWNLYHGDPRDLLMIDGKLLSEPFSKRASFGYLSKNDSSQVPFVDQLSLNSSLVINGKDTLSLQGINRKRDGNEMVLYTPEWGQSTLTAPGGCEWTLRKGKGWGQVNRQGSSPIPEDGFVLSASGTYAELLDSLSHKAHSVHFHDQWRSLLYPDRSPSIQHTSYHTAGPILLLEGRMLSHHEAEDIRESFASTPHPRTAIGISQDRQQLWLVVADGRQPELSVGMTLPALSQFLLGLGAHEGYNLDGGGSSTMVIADKIVNSPSDPKERRRCDALLLFAK